MKRKLAVAFVAVVAFGPVVPAAAADSCRTTSVRSTSNGTTTYDAIKTCTSGNKTQTHRVTTATKTVSQVWKWTKTGHSYEICTREGKVTTCQSTRVDN